MFLPWHLCAKTSNHEDLTTAWPAAFWDISHTPVAFLPSSSLATPATSDSFSVHPCFLSLASWSHLLFQERNVPQSGDENSEASVGLRSLVDARDIALATWGTATASCHMWSSSHPILSVLTQQAQSLHKIRPGLKTTGMQMKISHFGPQWSKMEPHRNLAELQILH